MSEWTNQSMAVTDNIGLPGTSWEVVCSPFLEDVLVCLSVKGERSFTVAHIVHRKTCSSRGQRMSNPQVKHGPVEYASFAETESVGHRGSDGIVVHRTRYASKG
jgi:hypothetical protein